MSRAPKRRDWPYWAYRTEREWKAAARARVRAALKALNEAQYGCAYYPGHGMERESSAIGRSQIEIGALLKRMSVKEWGR